MLIKNRLETLYTARSAANLANDPLSFCHRYPDPADQEVVGLIASSFAYGQVKIILNSLEKIFGVMGKSPRRFVEQFEPEQGKWLFTGFKHRFNDSRDLCALLWGIRTILEEADSISDFFLSGLSPDAPDITSALTNFSSAVLALDYAAVFGDDHIPENSYFPFFFPSPASGSACKRLCMYLRWMVRPADDIDLGIWREVPPAKLIIPVDAHIQRICGYLGFTKRRQADWKMAVEITTALRCLDPQDPVKYDFPLCHLGISEGCDGKDPERCLTCSIRDICRQDMQ